MYKLLRKIVTNPLNPTLFHLTKHGLEHREPRYGIAVVEIGYHIDIGIASCCHLYWRFFADVDLDPSRVLPWV
jgi:hypothetical protein